MSVHAGSLIHVGGNAVLDRIQSAGLGDVRVPIETIREVGNRETVDKVAGEPDFTFSMESFDVSTDMIAFLQGKVAASAAGSRPGSNDPDGTEYDWLDCKFVNIASPWKNAATGSAGTVQAGHLIPGFYARRVRYRYGATENAVQEAELAGGSFYYAEFAPVEKHYTGTGAQTAFATTDVVKRHRIGGAGGTTFKLVFGVLVDGQLQTEGVDYTVAGADGAIATVNFTAAPANGAHVTVSHFTSAAKSFPQTVHASTLVKPGAVRGRNIKVFLGSGGARERLGGIQTFELEATIEGEVERELGTEDIVGFSATGSTCNGTITIRAKDINAFFATLAKITGVSRTEVFGWFNQNSIPLEVAIENPKNPGQILKTLYVDEAIFQIPGTPARVNTATDFQVRYESKSDTFVEVKGAKV